MKEDTFLKLIEELKLFLRPYLTEKGVNIDERGWMSCISPQHNDKTPSMSFVPNTNESILHCFGCGANYTIFHAAKIFDGAARDGIEFIKETLPNLAKKYSVEFNSEDLKLSEEAALKYSYRALYKDAFEVLKEHMSYEHTAKRGWDKDICKEYGVGSINYQDFVKKLCSRGNYSPDELAERDIHNRLFGENLITFTIFDHKGKVAGFVARNTLYKKENKATHPKYRNTSNEVPIYNKSQILYGINAVKDRNGRLDIFEGYSDWVTAMTYDHPTCCAMGGVALTLEHLQMVKDLGFTHINLIFDGDETGKTKTGLYLDKYAGKIEGLKITVMELDFESGTPLENTDPDDYFKIHGLPGFMAVEPMTAFDWRLKSRIDIIKKNLLETHTDLEIVELNERFRELASDELTDLVDQMIPLIMAELSPVEQGRMSSKLAKLSGGNEADIRNEVTLRSNKQIKDIGDNIQKKLKNASDAIDIQDILNEGAKRIKEVTANKDITVYNHNEVMSHLGDFYRECDHPREELNGWRTGWEMMDNPLILGGIPKKESIITFAGPPNHGKSAILMNILKQLILPEQKNDKLTCLLWYLDDSRNVAWAKLLASMCRESILDVRTPNRSIVSDKSRYDNYIGWRQYLAHCVNQKKILVKSHDIGNDIDSLEYWIKHTQDTTGNDVLVFVDAVHDMRTGTSSDNDERIKFARIYDWAQATTERLAYSFLTCAHITKSGIAKGKPEQSDLSETGKILYASKVIGMVYSELDYLSSIYKKENATLYWTDENDHENVDKRKPIVQVNFSKNKETSFKGVMYFKHKADACYMEPITNAEADILNELNKTGNVSSNQQTTGANVDPEMFYTPKRLIDEDDITATA